MQTRKCFVIGPMNANHIKHLHWLADTVIEKILRDKKFEVFTPDVKETGNIMDHIIRSADRAELVIADTTGNNPNVLYEIAILDAMGRACIPVKLIDKNEKQNDQMPFDRAQYRYFEIAKDDTERAIKELTPVIDNVLLRQENGEFQDNPLTNFFGFPLSSLSSAHGLARGYFRNFVLQAVQGEIVEGPKEFVGVQKLPLECIIPDSVDLGTRGSVQEVVDSGTFVPVVLQAPGRKVPSYVWNKEISSDPVLVDIPTAFGQLRDNVISRMGPIAVVNPGSTEFKEIQSDEIAQFIRYLKGFTNKEPDSLGRLVRKRFKIIRLEDSRVPSLFE